MGLTSGGAVVKPHIGLRELRRHVLPATDFRGHKIKWASPFHSEAQSLQHGNCEDCPAWVQLNTRPLPNEVYIGGPAVALSCPADCEAVLPGPIVTKIDRYL